MKVKGISPIEQNVEKIVLGVAGVALLAVVAMQLLGGSTVEVKQGERRPIDQAYTPVREAARSLTAQMTEESPRLPDAPVVDLLGEYRGRAARPVAVRPQIAPLGPRMALSAGAAPVEAPVGDALYAAIRVPAPTTPSAHAFRSTLDPVQVTRNPALAAIVPASQPYDKAAVTVETTFDGRAFQAMLRADPDGDAGPIRPIPLRWWQDGLEIVAVHAERQVRRSDGTWSEPDAVRPRPGQINLLELPDGDGQFNPVTIRTVIASARQLSRQVQRPDYLRVIAGPQWMPPSAAATVAQIESRRTEIDRLRASRRDIERQLRIQEANLERDGGGGGQVAPGGGHDAPRQPQRPATQPAQVDPAIVAIRNRIANLNNELTRNETALRNLGVGLDGKPLQTWGENEDLASSLPPLENAAVRLWVHDLHAQPGSTYRYRIRVVMNNPFFGNAAALLPDQQSLAAEPFLHGEWSAWSPATSVEQDRYYFVTAANTRDSLGAAPRAQAEVFQFYYGFWRRGTASLSAGDLVVANLELPPPEVRPIYDVAAPPGPGQPPEFPGGHTPPPLEAMTPEERARLREGSQPPPIPGGPPVPGRIMLPPVAAPSNPGPPRLPPARANAVLLDVTMLPGAIDTGTAGMRDLVHAVIRTSAGLIEVRNPDNERTHALYRRLRQSSEEGMRQGQAEPEPTQPEETIPLLPPPTTTPGRPTPQPGGGGGGGGG